MAIAKKAKVNDARIKSLIWGDSGTGKSRFGLSAPNPLVVDLEDSTSLYANEFNFLVTKVYSSVKQQENPSILVTNICKEISQGVYPEIETLVIDPVTDLLDHIEHICVQSYEKQIGKNIQELNQLQKAKWYAYRRDAIRRMIDMLKALPVNLILICRSKDVWGKADGKMQPVGKTFDAHELLEWLMDVVIKLERGEKEGSPVGLVTKSRIGTLGNQINIENGYMSIVEAMDKNKKKQVISESQIKRLYTIASNN